MENVISIDKFPNLSPAPTISKTQCSESGFKSLILNDGGIVTTLKSGADLGANK